MFFLMFFSSLAALGRQNSCTSTKDTVCRRQTNSKILCLTPTAPPKKLFRYYLLTYKTTESRLDSLILRITLLSKNYPSLRWLLIVDADCDWRRRQTLQNDRTTLPGHTGPYEVPNRCMRVSTTSCERRDVRRRLERILHTRSCLL